MGATKKDAPLPERSRLEIHVRSKQSRSRLWTMPPPSKSESLERSNVKKMSPHRREKRSRRVVNHKHFPTSFCVFFAHRINCNSCHHPIEFSSAFISELWYAF